MDGGGSMPPFTLYAGTCEYPGGRLVCSQQSTQHTKSHNPNTYCPTHQQVLINLQIAVVVRQVGGAVQRREALVITLIDLSAVVQQVVHLRSEDAIGL